MAGPFARIPSPIPTTTLSARIMLTILVHRADATIAAQATGAMSWAFVTALRKNPQQSYVQLLNSIRDELATKYTQKPQLSCSHPLGMSSSGQTTSGFSLLTFNRY